MKEPREPERAAHTEAAPPQALACCSPVASTGLLSWTLPPSRPRPLLSGRNQPAWRHQAIILDFADTQEISALTLIATIQSHKA